MMRWFQSYPPRLDYYVDPMTDREVEEMLEKIVRWSRLLQGKACREDRMDRIRLWKVLREDGTTIHGRKGWTLPVDGPGEWMPAVKGELVACKNGYHLLSADQILAWAREDDLRIVECDYRGDPLDAGDKWVVREVRSLRLAAWSRRVLVAWACDCAERALAAFERRYPNDNRPRKCIETTRAWLRGGATIEQVWQACASASAASAASAAAYAAAADASASAAYAASASAASDASAAAAAAAASDAAYAAAAADRGKARAAEKAWQTSRLTEYLDGQVAP
jgi:hypothetical protein